MAILYFFLTLIGIAFLVFLAAFILELFPNLNLRPIESKIKETTVNKEIEESLVGLYRVFNYKGWYISHAHTFGYYGKNLKKSKDLTWKAYTNSHPK